MHGIVRFVRASLRLSIAVMFGVLLIILLYIIKTPPEKSVEEREVDRAKEQEQIADQKEFLQPLAESNVQEGRSLSEASEPVVEAYCVKCKQKRNMFNPRQTTTKNGRRAMEGSCPICGTRLFRFI